jgi:hypothetical protein
MKTVRKIWDRLTKRTKTVHVVDKIEYWGTATKWQREVPASATAEEICCQIFGTDWDPCSDTLVNKNYIRSSTSSTYCKGVITEIWWGEGAEERANGKYAELLAEGSTPTPQGW